MSTIFRLYWMLWRRFWLGLTVPGFSAAASSYASRSARFEGRNRIYENGTVLDSELGLFSYVSRGARVANCSAGRYCCIGPEALVGGLGVHPTRWISSHPVFYSPLRQTGGVTFSPGRHFEERPRVTLGHDVWIGARAIVLDGIKVGTGAIVAAGAVVAEDVPPYAIVGGLPARILRPRFEPSIAARLLALEWWTWPTGRLEAAAALFRSDDIAGALSELEALAPRTRG